MKEYKVEKFTNIENLEEYLNKMSAEGWELVSQSYWKDIFPYFVITFAKEKQAEE